MKTTLLFLAAMLASLNLSAQGTVSWGNTSHTLLTNGITQEPISPAGAFRVALYYDNVAGAAEADLSLYGSVLSSSLPGRFFPGTATLNDVVGGALATFQVRAWAGEFATYEEAIIGGGLYGTSRVITIGTGWIDGGSPPPAPPLFCCNPATQLQGFTLIPEPSVLDLALLGVGVCLVRYRRNRSNLPKRL